MGCYFLRRKCKQLWKKLFRYRPGSGKAGRQVFHIVLSNPNGKSRGDSHKLSSQNGERQGDSPKLNTLWIKRRGSISRQVHLPYRPARRDKSLLLESTQFSRILTGLYCHMNEFQALLTHLGLHLDALAKNCSLGTKTNCLGGRISKIFSAQSANNFSLFFVISRPRFSLQVNEYVYHSCMSILPSYQNTRIENHSLQKYNTDDKLWMNFLDVILFQYVRD